MRLATEDSDFDRETEGWVGGEVRRFFLDPPYCHPGNRGIVLGCFDVVVVCTETTYQDDAGAWVDKGAHRIMSALHKDEPIKDILHRMGYAIASPKKRPLLHYPLY